MNDCFERMFQFFSYAITLQNVNYTKVKKETFSFVISRRYTTRPKNRSIIVIIFYLHLLKKKPKYRIGSFQLLTLTVNVLVHQWVRFELEWTPWPWNGKQVSAFAALPFAEHAVLLLLLLD